MSDCQWRSPFSTIEHSSVKFSCVGAAACRFKYLQNSTYSPPKPFSVFHDPGLFNIISIRAVCSHGRSTGPLRSTFLQRDNGKTIQIQSVSSLPQPIHRWRRRKSWTQKKEKLKTSRDLVINMMEDIEPLSVAVEMLSAGFENKSLTNAVNYDKIEDAYAELELAKVKVAVVEDFSDNDDEFSEESKEAFRKEARTLLPVSRSGRKMVEFYGTPDITVPMSRVPCHGCGALLHCKDPGIPGYVPSQKFIATPETDLKDIHCQRCHILNVFNIAIDVSVGPSDYEAILNEIKKQTTALVVMMVDMTDLPNSFYKSISSLMNRKRPIYLVGNKVDLLPKDDTGYLKRIKESLVQLCEENGLSSETNIKHIALISAKTGYGIEELITQLMRDWSIKGQIYLLGCTNVGKSTLFNALLSSDFCRSSARDILHRATTSPWPGTTLNLLKFPIVNLKPSILHKRIERLERERSNEVEEEKLRRLQLKSSGHWYYATLMGHIGTSISTPKQTALEDKLQNYSGFVVPSYTFDKIEPDNLIQNHGIVGLVNHLKPNVKPYDDTIFKYWCYDTPGIINPEQVINLLNAEELSVILPNKLIKPRTYVLKPQQVMFVSGLARIDYFQGDVSIYFTVFAAAGLPVHVLNNDDEADDFYNANIGTSRMAVPLGDMNRRSLIPSLVGKEFTIEGLGWKESVSDVVLSSIGWVSVTAGLGRSVRLKAYTPGGLGCNMRTPSLLKYAVNLRGKRIQRTPAYRTRAPKMC